MSCIKDGGDKTDLRDFIKKDMVVEEEVSTEYEIAKILLENQDQTIFFDNVKGYGFKVVGNLCPSREALCHALGTDEENYIKTVLRALDRPIEPVITEKGECQEIKVKDLEDIPALKHFKGDGGRYVTSGIVIAKSKAGRNVSVHRLMVLDNSKVAIRLVERHLYEYFKEAEKRGDALEVAIAIGVHPAIFFASSYSVPLGYDEFRLASSLLREPLELVKCKTVDLEVPRHAEIVMEGRILPREKAKEGPFVDITGTYDIVREQPIIEITNITHREDPIYHALLPGGREHKIFMGMPQEPKIFRAVENVAKVKNVCLTDGGCNWLHGAVSIFKEREEDGKKAIEAALDAHRSMKHVIIVDDDIDIFDAREVEYAIATRFQGDRDMILIKDVKGSSLDPSARGGAITTKMGLDATKYLAEKDKFMRAE